MTSATIMHRTRHRPYRVRSGGGGGNTGHTNNIVSNNNLASFAVSDSYQRVGQFANDGTPENMIQIRKKGMCPTCGRIRTHKKRASLLNVGSSNGLGAFYMEPLTREGEVHEGYCLKCHTLEEILRMPDVKRSSRKSGKSKTNNKTIVDRHHQVEAEAYPGAPPSAWSVGSGSLGGPGVDVTRCAATRTRPRTTQESIDDLTETSLSFDYDYGSFCDDDIASFSGLSIDEEGTTEEGGDFDCGGTVTSSDFGSSVQTPSSSRGRRQHHNHNRSYSVDDGRSNVSRRSQQQRQRTHIRSSSAENSVEVSSIRHGAGDDDKTMKSIIRDMMRHPNDPSIQEYGCVSLGRHAHEPTRRIVAAIDVIVEAMNSHPDRVGVQVEACRTFRRFTSASSCQNAAAKKDRNRSVCAGDDIEVNVESCTKLVVLGGLFAVLSAMKNHPDTLAVQKAGIRVLRNTLRANQQARTIIVEHADGAVGTITRAMWMHDTSVQLQEDGCVVLWSLAYGDVDTQFDIVRNEGVGAIVKAMSTHRDVEKVHYNACGALHTLSFDEDVKRAVVDNGGTFSALFCSMREHGYSELVTERACSALVNLAVSVDSGGSSPESCRSSGSGRASATTNRLCVMKENEIDTLLYQMEVHKDSASIQRSACRLLAIAARSRSNLRALRDNAKIRPILREAAENFPDDCVDSASYVLSLIDTRRR